MSKPAPVDFSMILASSVHDMKNSVGMLLNSLESIIADLPPGASDGNRRVATLQYEAARINSELIQLLAIYRMQNNLLPVNIDQHYVIEVLEEQLARNESLLQLLNLELEVHCDEDFCWFFDAELIGGVIHNTLVNSARYAKQKLLISVSESKGCMSLCIADDGPGFPQFMLDDHLSALKMPVDFQAGNTHLGLYFASRAADLHTRDGMVGSIHLSNGAPLKGGLFELILP